jgi:hypothetical protein
MTIIIIGLTNDWPSLVIGIGVAAAVLGTGVILYTVARFGPDA